MVMQKKGKSRVRTSRPRREKVMSYSRNQPMRTMSGHGDYNVRLDKNSLATVKEASKRSGKSWGDLIVAGSALLGGIAGGPAGAMLGGLGGQVVSKLMGQGTYSVRKNSIIHPTQSEQVPAFGNVSGGTRVRHREYIADINSSTTFTNTSYPINVGNSDVFPWLSAIAQNYEQYTINGMVFEFISTSANALNNTNTALGTVIMSTQYNSLAPPFINKQQMENNIYTVSCKPSESVMHPIECEIGQTPNNPLYVYAGLSPPTGDIRLYNLGNFQLATVGSQAVANIGELHVSYDITLYKPQLSSGLALEAETAWYNFGYNGVPGVITTSNYFGSSSETTQVVFDSIGLDINYGSNTITCPLGLNGIYRWEYNHFGAYVDNTAPPSVVISNAVGVSSAPYNGFGNTISGAGPQLVTAPDSFYGLEQVIIVSDPTQQVVFSFTSGTGVVADNPNYSIFQLQQLNGNFPH